LQSTWPMKRDCDVKASPFLSPQLRTSFPGNSPNGGARPPPPLVPVRRDPFYDGPDLLHPRALCRMNLLLVCLFVFALCVVLSCRILQLRGWPSPLYFTWGSRQR
jgi:hypothetical protein